MRAWPNDASVAHLIFIDHLDVPSPEAIESAIEHARCRGARAIRTSALFPRAAGVVLGAGFEPIDRLALLRLALDDLTLARLPRPDPSDPMMPWHARRAAVVDQQAFGLMWGNDAASLRDIRRATPQHRARIVRRGRRIAGLAISGAAGANGYLQRVAVAPAHQRGGIARTLVVDALRWMSDRDLSLALVNTGVHNAAGLALYHTLGFERLDDELVIAEHRLTE